MWIKLNDLIEYFNFPKDTMNKLKNKYPEKYNDDDVFDVEFEWIENDRPCFNSIKVFWETDHVKFSNTIEYNTSSPMAMWLCNVLPCCECDDEIEEIDITHYSKVKPAHII
jgi:hypothetical protein